MSITRLALCVCVPVLLAGVACGLIPVAPRPAPPPLPSTALATSARAGTAATPVTGHATDTSRMPVGGVVVGFRPTSSPASCASCIQTAATGSDGSYSLRLAPDTYGVACVSPAGRCAAGNSAAGGSTSLTVTSDPTTLDVHVSTAPTPPPVPPESSHTTTPTPPDPPDTSSFSGVVTLTDGRPIRGVTVEFKAEPSCQSCAQPYVKSDASGHYAIDLPAGVYNATCVLESFDFECGPRGGDGTPHPVQVPPTGQRLDFIVCPIRRYPACLT